jgi:hypothetical protein
MRTRTATQRHLTCRPGRMLLPASPSQVLKSFTQVGSDARIRRRCHLIVSFLLEREYEKEWSLGDSNP